MNDWDYPHALKPWRFLFDYACLLFKQNDSSHVSRVELLVQQYCSFLLQQNGNTNEKYGNNNENTRFSIPLTLS